jgi:hypothetical protein
MHQKRLSALFRSILAASLSAAPLALGQMACGGAIAPVDDEGDDDASVIFPNLDASVQDDDNTVEPDRDASIPLRDGGRKDASVTDANRVDAKRSDAGCLPPDASVPAPDFCTYYVLRPCDLSPDAGYLSSEQCREYCGDGGAFFCNYSSGLTNGGDTTNAYIQCNTCAIGRRPDGFEGACVDTSNGSVLGAYFATVAALEAASIDAFRILKSELEAHRAPKRLVRGAERSAREEVRHTRATRAAARRHGARAEELRMPRVSRPSAPRSLEAIALENAVEGCVRETFGALTATWQAERAEDPEIRAMMQEIAADETRHAALSWSVARWADARLTADERARVAAAIRHAVHVLEWELRADPAEDLVRAAGLPRASEAKSLLAQMRAALPLAA